jgi:hypothetical protein
MLKMAAIIQGSVLTRAGPDQVLKMRTMERIDNLSYDIDLFAHFQ